MPLHYLGHSVNTTCGKQIHTKRTGADLLLLWTLQCTQRERIDKYLDTRRPIATAADRVATDHFQKLQSQDGGLPKLLLAYSCLTNHSEAPLLWLVKPKQDVGDHQWCVICCDVEHLNSVCKTCAHQMLRLFSSSHLAIITIPVASGLFTSSAPVCAYLGELVVSKVEDTEAGESRQRVRQALQWVLTQC